LPTRRSEIIETVYICSYNGDFHHSCEEVIVITESCGGGGGGTDPDDPFGDDGPYDDPWNWPDPDCDGPEGCGGGGSGSGGGGTSDCDPNAILPPVGCEEPANNNDDDELAFLGDITIDASVLNNPKARCVLDGLFEGETNTLSETIVKFADESVNIDLVIELTDLGPSNGNTNGQLDSTNPSSFRLQLNENRITNRTPIEIAATYLHEAIHAEMRRFLHGATDTSTLPGFPGDFADDWPNYVQAKFGAFDRPLEAAEHHAMAEKYVAIIADGLEEYDNNQLSRGHYEALAWNGLVNLDPWNNLPQSQRNEYGTKYVDALEGRSLNCN